MYYDDEYYDYAYAYSRYTSPLLPPPATLVLVQRYADLAEVYNFSSSP